MIKRNQTLALGRNMLILALLAAPFSVAVAGKAVRPGGGGSVVLPRVNIDAEGAPTEGEAQCHGVSCATVSGAARYDKSPVSKPNYSPAENGGSLLGGGSAINVANRPQGGGKGVVSKAFKRWIVSAAAQTVSFFSGKGELLAGKAHQALTNAVRESVAWDPETRNVLRTFLQTSALDGGGLPAAIEDAKGITDSGEQKAWLKNMIEQCSLPTAGTAAVAAQGAL